VQDLDAVTLQIMQELDTIKLFVNIAPGVHKTKENQMVCSNCLISFCLMIQISASTMILRRKSLKKYS
jgi:hypothetical protein